MDENICSECGEEFDSCDLWYTNGGDLLCVECVKEMDDPDLVDPGEMY